MVPRQVLQSLSDEELSVLLYLTNKLQPPGFGIEVNENMLTAYKRDALIRICATHRDKIKLEFVQLYDTMVAKLNGVTIINDTPDGEKSDQHDNLVVS
jgi:hypothetical protein